MDSKQKLLSAYTPTKYEPPYPPYVNITQVDSMVRITFRGDTKADGSVGDSAVATVNAWQLNKIAEIFKEASANFEAGFNSPDFPCGY